MKALAYYDGKIGAPEELAVPLTTVPTSSAIGCYDAAMAAGGTIFLLEDHLDRFYASARLLDIHIPMEKQALGELLTQLARQVEGESCFVYWQVSGAWSHGATPMPKICLASCGCWFVLRSSPTPISPSV